MRSTEMEMARAESEHLNGAYLVCNRFRGRMQEISEIRLRQNYADTVECRLYL